ncbi:MAG TPA: GlmU family protein [Bacteroidia bacterium]|nr:GlmU family protein [Bacteroidia bacterium]HRH09762.1 GlmU family protein [Bacteroidia bacterium]HRH63520.1 GlmU family protein [Bacteroidia bacterium]
MNFIFFDDKTNEQLLPLTFTRPVADIRVGILTIREKWEKALGVQTSFVSKEYLSLNFPLRMSESEDNVFINGSLCPNAELISKIAELKEGEALVNNETLLAINNGASKFVFSKFSIKKHKNVVPFDGAFFKINHVWEIFTKNAEAILQDFIVLTAGRKTKSISRSNKFLNPDWIFIEEGATVECSVLNASEGPIYIAADAEVMEGSLIRGPFALCEHSTLKMGAKVYGATTIGPNCKVGGEISNSVILGYSNKAHDGFLGNSVIGEWCNLGADTNNSNLKNNYSKVQLYNYPAKKYVDTGLQFCGLIMGDHSKCGINTMFNTGTVVGVSANVFGAGFPDKFIPSFTWGGVNDTDIFDLDKAIELAERVYQRRGLTFDEPEKKIMNYLFKLKK